MYWEHFQLSEAPFSITPDPRFVFMSERHREALAHLFYSLTGQNGFVLLTGEVGTGKTTLCRCILEQVPDALDVALILNPALNARELVASICDELGVEYEADAEGVRPLYRALNEHLLGSHRDGRRTVLIIDEAQNLDASVLEQVRLLTNLETATQKLLQIVLIGQPELRDLLARQDLRQLAQRVTARYHLMPLDAVETAAYVRHRLAVCGGHASLFSNAALRAVQRHSGGVPRLINTICDRALLGAYASGRPQVTPAIVERAAGEVLQLPARRRWLRPAVAAALTGVALSVGAMVYNVGVDWPGTGAGWLASVMPGSAGGTSPAPPPRAPAETGFAAAEAPASAAAATPEAPASAAAGDPVSTPAPSPSTAATLDPPALPAAVERHGGRTGSRLPGKAADDAQVSASAATAPDMARAAAPTANGAAAVADASGDRVPAPLDTAGAAEPLAALRSAVDLAGPALPRPPAPPLAQSVAGEPAADRNAGPRAASREARPAPEWTSALPLLALPEVAYTLLFQQWGLDYAVLPGADACERAAWANLRCHTGRAGLDDLLAADRPAVLILPAEDLPPAHLVLTGVAGERLVLAGAEGPVSVAATAVAARWPGEFLMLWRAPPGFPADHVALGARGPHVAWLRRALERVLEVTEPAEDASVFDAEMGRLVRAFQGAHDLATDGIIGRQTTMALNGLTPDAGVPRLR